eukprot:TRINITY_DN1745_c0_g1_i1.p1 TRINITY_DN1745_c0_g1~~TRINITY_DN1745_c0_g1_i1.p1  ORF type:complete len:386 (-),score=124.62 TRINITY_DN1745_c0_g1_i1:73-1191(-)
MEEAKQSKGSKKDKGSKKEKKTESSRSSGTEEAAKLRKDISALKEKIKQSRLEKKDMEKSEYFTQNPSNFEKGAKPTERVRLSKGHNGRIEAVSWSSNNPEMLLTAGQDGKMLVWHAPSGNKVGLFRLKSAWVQACAYRSFGGESGVVASGGMDNICTLYSLQDPSKPIHELDGHSGFIAACKFLDDKQLLTASADYKTILWDAQSGKSLQSFEFEEGATSLSVNKAGDKFLVGVTNGVVALCDPKSGKQVADFEAHEDSVCSVSFFPNDTAFGTASDDLTCHLYDIRSADNCLQSYDAPEGATELTSICFSKSGRFLFASYDDAVRVWDTTEGKLLYTLSVPAKVSALDINCDGTALCSVSHDNEGRIWAI